MLEPWKEDEGVALIIILGMALNLILVPAIAVSRGWTLATDDGKALRIAGERGIATITTPEILVNWAEGTSAPPARIGEALREIEERARFVAPRRSPHAEWWMRHLRG